MNRNTKVDVNHQGQVNIHGGGVEVLIWCSYCGARIIWSAGEPGFLEGECRECESPSVIGIADGVIQVVEMGL